MIEYAYSAALIVPAPYQDAANRISCALGRDVPPGSTFAAPLSASGNPPATHFGTHTFVDEAFVNIIQAALRGDLPPVDWSLVGLSPVRVRQAFAAMTAVTVESRTPAAWNSALSQTGLQPVKTDSNTV